MLHSILRVWVNISLKSIELEFYTWYEEVNQLIGIQSVGNLLNKKNQLFKLSYVASEQIIQNLKWNFLGFFFQTCLLNFTDVCEKIS